MHNTSGLEFGVLACGRVLAFCTHECQLALLEQSRQDYYVHGFAAGRPIPLDGGASRIRRVYTRKNPLPPQAGNGFSNSYQYNLGRYLLEDNV